MFKRIVQENLLIESKINIRSLKAQVDTAFRNKSTKELAKLMTKNEGILLKKVLRFVINVVDDDKPKLLFLTSSLSEVIATKPLAVPEIARYLKDAGLSDVAAIYKLTEGDIWKIENSFTKSAHKSELSESDFRKVEVAFISVVKVLAKNFPNVEVNL